MQHLAINTIPFTKLQAAKQFIWNRFVEVNKNLFLISLNLFQKEKIAFQPGVRPERRQDHMDLAIGDSDNEVDDSNDAKQSLKDIDKFDRKLKSRNDRPDDSDSD